MRGWYRRDPGWLSTAMGSWCNAMREEGTLLVLGSEKVKTQLECLDMEGK